MVWSSLGIFLMSPQWQFSAPTEGNFFRVRSTLSAPPPWIFRGLIAQASAGASPVLTAPRRVWAVPGEWVAFQLDRPEWMQAARSIALKRTGDYKTKIQWTVYLDVWTP